MPELLMPRTDGARPTRGLGLRVIVCALSIVAFAEIPAIAWAQSAEQPAGEAPAAQAPAEGTDAAPAATDSPADPAATAIDGMPIDGAAPDGTAIDGGLLPRDLSPWGMFMQADWVVKGVMIGLALASVITWTVWLAKSLELAASKRRTRAMLRTLQAAGTLGEAVSAITSRRGAAAALVQAANHELHLSAGLDADGIKERIASVFERIVHAAARQAGRGTGLLATIGATAPFVGLFGTVWGIMNSFIGIAEAETTNLAVVAPGIAEALLATAIGLAAAIPAVVIYNHFTRLIASYRALLGDAAAGVQQLVSRDLDRRRIQALDHLRDAAE